MLRQDSWRRLPTLWMRSRPLRDGQGAGGKTG